MTLRNTSHSRLVLVRLIPNDMNRGRRSGIGVGRGLCIGLSLCFSGLVGLQVFTKGICGLVDLFGRARQIVRVGQEILVPPSRSKFYIMHCICAHSPPDSPQG